MTCFRISRSREKRRNIHNGDCTLLLLLLVVGIPFALNVWDDENVQGSPLLRVAAKCKAVEPSKSTQVTSETSPIGTTGCNKGFSPFGMHVYTIFVLLLWNWLEVLVFLFGQSIFVWCLLSELPSSIMARASNKTLVAKPSRTKCKGVRPRRSPHCATVKSFKCRLCIYGDLWGISIINIPHMYMLWVCKYIYIYVHITYIYIYTLDCIIIIYGCIILILCTCCTFIHVDRVHVKYTFNVSSGISHLFVYVQNIKLACVTLLFWTLQSNNRVALAKHTNTLDSLELYNKDPHNGFLLSLYTI